MKRRNGVAAAASGRGRDRALLPRSAQPSGQRSVAAVAASDCGFQTPTPPLPRSRERGPGGEGACVRLTLALLVATLLCLTAAQSARADGEAGVVIDEDGQVRTYCVAFEGDSISGDDLLAAAGIDYEDLGTGAGAVLCAIEDTGCFDASSYNTCWCECQSGGSDCVYWAFFTRDHGEGWVYSARAFDRVDANDGDLHAWKWGEGGPSSAPRPSDAITFESVCGHPPGGGAQPPTAPAPAATLPPGGTSAPSPGTAAPTGASDTSTPFTAAPATSPGTPGVSVTFTEQPSTTPLPPAAARNDDEDDGGSPVALIGFGAVALALVGAIGAAAYWRRTHGS